MDTPPLVESPRSPRDQVGDRYLLERKLGQGGMGTVWAARNTMTGRRVALKLLRAAAEATSRQRLLREARAAGSLEHPNVCQVLDVVELPNEGLALVLELLEGETLAARLARCGRLSTEETARILGPVVSAIGAAHALGVVHRDIKPDNIFITRDGVSKVLDFGIAKVRSEGPVEDGSSLTVTGSVLGTPAYMAPEQIFGEKDIDHRADIWALGLVLYECLSGVSPTRSQAENVGQVLKTILARPIQPLSEVAPEVPQDLLAITMRMLSRTREKRPETLEETFDVLRGHADFAAPAFGAPQWHGEAPLAGTATPDGSDGILEETAAARSAAPRSGATPQTMGGTSHRPMAQTASRRRSLVLVAALAVPISLLAWKLVGASAPVASTAVASGPAASSETGPPSMPLLSETEVVVASASPSVTPTPSAITEPTASASAAPLVATHRVPAAPARTAQPAATATAKPKTDPLGDAR